MENCGRAKKVIYNKVLFVKLIVGVLFYRVCLALLYPHSSDCKAVVLTAIHESHREGRASLG
jgi:hypothetical protein